MVSTAELAKYALRAAQGFVILARGEFFALLARVESESLPLRREARFLGLVLWIEAADNPALTLDHRQSNDHRKSTVQFPPSLFEPFSPLSLIVLISNQQDAGQFGNDVAKIENSTVGRSGVGLGGLLVVETAHFESRAQR